MTDIYFVRHAEPNFDNHDDRTRELTEKGLEDRKLVTRFLADKSIDAVLSSPFKRAMDTMQDFADSQNLAITPIEDFRERKVESAWIVDFDSFSKKQWEDFDYKLSDGETLREVQTRNIAALKQVLHDYAGKTIAIGSHGTALSTIINYYEPSFQHAQFEKIRKLMPWVVKFSFEGEKCVGIWQYNLFKSFTMSDPIKKENTNNIPPNVSTSQVIGTNLRQVRLMRNLTLDDVSAISSVSKGMLSQIENGNKSPTINILYKICEAMHVSINSLLRYPIPDIQVVRNPEKLELKDRNIVPLYEYNIQNSMEVSKAYFAPHSKRIGSSHGDDVWEYVFVIEGEFTLVLDNESYTITKGETLRFRANRYHIYENATDDDVWIYNLIFYDMPMV